MRSIWDKYWWKTVIFLEDFQAEALIGYLEIHIGSQKKEGDGTVSINLRIIYKEMKMMQEDSFDKKKYKMKSNIRNKLILVTLQALKET